MRYCSKRNSSAVVLHKRNQHCTFGESFSGKWDLAMSWNVIRISFNWYDAML